jgi:hypothetical protein
MATTAAGYLSLEPFRSFFDEPHGAVRHRFSGGGHELLDRFLQPVDGVLKILCRPSAISPRPIAVA